MTIKSDRWIIEQAEAGMIDPFEPGQVRHQDGNKVISYGTSSYGYDVRCGPQFKVFTNIHSATVDPKAFDAKVLSMSKMMCASSRPTLSPWRARLSTSAYQKMY